jgi:hypothetical protein
MLSLGDGKDQRRWVKARDSIIALKAVKIEALDKAGDVLRVMLLEEPDDPEAQEAREQKKQANETQLVQVARLLNEAALNASKMHEGAYLKSFEMVTGLAKSVLEAHNRQVTLINGLLRRIAAAEAHVGDEGGGGGGVQQMLAGILMQGAMGGAASSPLAAAAAAATRNGAATPPAAADESETEGD